MEGFPCPNCSSTIRIDSLRCRICGYKLQLSSNATGVNDNPLEINSLSESELAEIRKDYLKKQPGESRRPSDESMREVLAEAKVRKFKRFATRFTVLILLIGFIAFAINSKSANTSARSGNASLKTNSQANQQPVKVIPPTECQVLDKELKVLRSNSKNVYKSYIRKYNFFINKKKTVVSGQDSKDLEKYFKDTFSANIELQKSYVRELKAASRLPKCWRANTFTQIEISRELLISNVNDLTSYENTDIFKLMVWGEASMPDSAMFKREAFKDVVFKYRSKSFLDKN